MMRANLPAAIQRGALCCVLPVHGSGSALAGKGVKSSRQAPGKKRKERGKRKKKKRTVESAERRANRANQKLLRRQDRESHNIDMNARGGPWLRRIGELREAFARSNQKVSELQYSRQVLKSCKNSHPPAAAQSRRTREAK
jgi:hypothetical protein